MSDAQRQVTPFQSIQKQADSATLLPTKINRSLRPGNPPNAVCDNRLFQRLEPQHTVVKLGNGFLHLLWQQICKPFLEQTKGAPYLARLSRSHSDMRRGNPFDEHIGSPVVRVTIPVIGRAAPSRHQRHSSTRQVKFVFCTYFFSEMIGDHFYVVHDQLGVQENVVVDALQDVADRCAALPTGYNVGVVDVALSPHMTFLELGHDLKLAD